MRTTFAGLLLLPLLAAACAGSTPSPSPGSLSPLDGRLIDLTHPFERDTIFWPTETEGFVLEPVFAGETPHGWYAANRFRTAEHGGTHLDAPYHFAREGEGADQIPLERLFGPARVVDGSMSQDPDGGVTAAALAAHEAEVGPIAPGTIVLIHTGHGRFWHDRTRYLGTDRTGPEAVPDLHFPGLSAALARLLVERRVAAVGIDTASIDPGPSTDFQAHHTLAAAGIPIFENVANMELLPELGFRVVALPMKIRRGTGGPLRIVAIVPEGQP